MADNNVSCSIATQIYIYVKGISRGELKHVELPRSWRTGVVMGLSLCPLICVHVTRIGRRKRKEARYYPKIISINCYISPLS